jgi:hypothetical protein
MSDQLSGGPLVLLMPSIVCVSVERVCEKNSSATANQNRNNQRHERFSCGKRFKYLLRE